MSPFSCILPLNISSRSIGAIHIFSESLTYAGAKAVKKKRDEMTTQLRSTCAMISKVTALETTKSPVEARLRPGYGEVMAEQLRNSYENLAERSADLCALWTSATLSLKTGEDIDCEELKRETHEPETMLQAFEVGIFADAKDIK